MTGDTDSREKSYVRIRYREDARGIASRALDFAYDKPGNLTSKLSNVGADLDVTGYAYGTAGKPHRLTSVTIGGVANTLSYDANGNLTQYTAASGPHTWLSYDGRNHALQNAHPIG